MEGFPEELVADPDSIFVLGFSVPRTNETTRAARPTATEVVVDNQ